MTLASIPPLPAPSVIDFIVLLVLPLSLMFLVALAGWPGLRARLGSGLALGLAALAVPPAMTYVGVLVTGHGF